MTNYEIMRMIRKVSKRRHKAVVYRSRLISVYGYMNLARAQEVLIEQYGRELADLFARLK